MKIALVGYGKMGRAIEQLAQGAGCTVVARIDRGAPLAFGGAEVCLDFASAEGILQRAESAVRAGCDLVIGTTGWERERPEVERIVQGSDRGAIAAANFSLGVHLFLRLAEQAALLFRPFAEYDVGMYELHHRHKRDAPSGTALAIAAKIGHPDCPAVRCGSIPGTHTVLYDSPVDTIELTHRARGRDGFAAGALQAARWIAGRPGFFTIDDLVEEALQCT